jgi:serine/threonine-protein kinase
MVELDDRLQAIVRGHARPAGAAECIELARLCCRRNHHATAVRFFTQAFAADPKLADNQGVSYRYRAACAAAQAGCGQDKGAAGPDQVGRSGLRRQALEWLRADLDRRVSRLPAAPQDRAVLVAVLRRWQNDPALAGVRDASALATLPPAERARWQKLWADVAALRSKAEGKTK